MIDFYKPSSKGSDPKGNLEDFPLNVDDVDSTFDFRDFVSCFGVLLLDFLAVLADVGVADELDFRS